MHPNICKLSSKHSKHSKLLGNTFLPIINDTCNSLRNGGMPVHRVGPVHNFHQIFNINHCGNPIDKQCQLATPTGIPQMGWRNFYLENFNKYQVPNQDPFSGTPIRNFLNNLENVDNIYRKCL